MDGKTYEQAQDNLSPKPLSQATFQYIKETLVKLFVVRTNLITERFSFHRLCQMPGQRIKDYIALLRRQASKCRFGIYANEALTYQLVFGVVDNNIRRRLLSTVEF